MPLTRGLTVVFGLCVQRSWPFGRKANETPALERELRQLETKEP